MCVYIYIYARNTGTCTYIHMCAHTPPVGALDNHERNLIKTSMLIKKIVNPRQ